jgi:Arc/MetJ-type ribon-helix-helix transcriptional regulator
MLNAMQQLVTRIDDDLAAALDRLVDDGVVANRSEAVRLGLRHLIDQHRRQGIAAQIVAGYERMPQTEAEIGWVDDATAAMIADEPW